jgi:two-component system, OmpR family, response regulator
MEIEARNGTTALAHGQTAFRIVVVDDDAELRDLLTRYLENAGFGVRAVADGKALDALLAEGEPDLVVLDLMLPGEDGLSICRRLRAESAVPILMLTAAGEAIDRVVGIEIGADDYMAKPFLPRELLARIRAIVRRTGTRMPRTAPRTRYQFAGWVLDEYDCSLHSTTHGRVELTGGEYRLLHALVSAPGRVLSREMIAKAMHGRSIEAFDRSVDVAISRMRKKLAGDANGPNLIRSVHALGYVFSGKVEMLTQ